MCGWIGNWEKARGAVRGNHWKSRREIRGEDWGGPLGLRGAHKNWRGQDYQNRRGLASKW